MLNESVFGIIAMPHYYKHEP